MPREGVCCLIVVVVAVEDFRVGGQGSSPRRDRFGCGVSRRLCATRSYYRPLGSRNPNEVTSRTQAATRFRFNLGRMGAILTRMNQSLAQATRLLVASLAMLPIFLGGCAYPPPELPAADESIESRGELSWPRRGAISALLKFRAWTGARSGYVALVARDGRVEHGYTVGYQDIEAGIPMSMDTRFRMASMTKPVTAVAAMILVEEGKLSLDDPVSKYLPNFGEMRVALNPETDGELETTEQSPPMLVRHLLSFVSGIGGGGWGASTTIARQHQEKNIYNGEGSLEDRIDRLAGVTLYEQPGTRWRYGSSLDVIARIVEIASGEAFDDFLRARIFRPLGMDATYFPKNLPEGVPLAKLYTQNEDGDLVLSSRSSFHAADWTPGGSGLVSTAPDYMRFALMLWNRGEYNGVRILKTETVDEMTRLHVPSGVLEDFGIEGLGFGLGVSVMADEDAALIPGHNGDFWWSGAHGTHFWISPETGVVVVVLLQNAMGPHAGMPVAPYLVQGLAN